MSRDRIALLVAQTNHSFGTEDWFPPLAPALEGLTSAQAAWQPDGKGHSIWQLLNHMSFWKQRVLLKLAGMETPPGPNSNDETFGGPGDPGDVAGWAAAVQRARDLNGALQELLSSWEDADLDKLLDKTPYGVVINNMLMHDAYHTGQIVLLRKQQGSWPSRR